MGSRVDRAMPTTSESDSEGHRSGIHLSWRPKRRKLSSARVQGIRMRNSSAGCNEHDGASRACLADGTTFPESSAT